MNNKQTILFVTLVSDLTMYEICKSYIQALHVPEDYQVQFLPIEGASSMAAGYNTAIQIPSKYKVYLHQDTFIIDKDFIYKILQLFFTSSKLGLLGTLGTKILCKESCSYGKLYLKNELLCFNDVDGPYEEVDIIDGYLMATQYDIPWRSDLFTGFHLYDASQSLEFRERGFSVGVVRQDTPWTVHYVNHDMNPGWELYHNIFMDEYKGYIEKTCS